jgi:spore coat protein A
MDAQKQTIAFADTGSGDAGRVCIHPGSSCTWSHVLSQNTKSAPIREMPTQREKSKEREEMVFTRRQLLKTGAVAGAALSAPRILTIGKAGAAPPGVIPTAKDPRFSVPVIDPGKIDKFIDALPVPGPNWPVITAGSETIKLVPVTTQILPSTLGLTTPCWSYRGNANYASTFLGPTMLAQSGTANIVTYDYSGLSSQTIHLLRRGNDPSQSVIDFHVHGTDMGEPQVRFIAHLHGAHGVSPGSDGYAESWSTPAATSVNGAGPAPVNAGPGIWQHTYPNAQTASLAWYHDHALGITRLNVYAGGAGGYIITDNVEQGYITSGQLPDLGIPLVIQDRMFYPDGRLAYPDLDAVAAGLIAQKGHTPWPVTDVSTRPEYFGDVIVVNGVAWPFLTVAPQVYRFRFLDGCNSRVLDLSFQPPKPPSFAIIGTEGGFLPSPSDVRPNLVFGGAERFDVLIDFRAYAGQTLTLINKGAKKPFPGGTPPNSQSDALVMQFRVTAGVGQPLSPPPLRWNANTPPASGTTRRVLLYEGLDQFGRIQPVLGTVTGTDPFTAVPKFWDDPVTENPKTGTVEVWEIFNTTADSHPIHIHEVFIRVLNRQPIAFDKKLIAAICNAPLPNFPITVGGAQTAATGYETGFKDTALCPPGQVTRAVVDFQGATPGRFVWHCHILEHEDHEMMRPYDVIS